MTYAIDSNEYLMVRPSLQRIETLSNSSSVLNQSLLSRIEVIRLALLAISDLFLQSVMVVAGCTAVVMQLPLYPFLDDIDPREVFLEAKGDAQCAAKIAVAILLTPVVGILSPDEMPMLFAHMGLFTPNTLSERIERVFRSRYVQAALLIMAINVAAAVTMWCHSPNGIVKPVIPNAPVPKASVSLTPFAYLIIGSVLTYIGTRVNCCWQQKPELPMSPPPSRPSSPEGMHRRRDSPPSNSSSDGERPEGVISKHSGRRMVRRYSASEALEAPQVSPAKRSKLRKLVEEASKRQLVSDKRQLVTE